MLLSSAKPDQPDTTKLSPIVKQIVSVERRPRIKRNYIGAAHHSFKTIRDHRKGASTKKRWIINDNNDISGVFYNGFLEQQRKKSKNKVDEDLILSAVVSNIYLFPDHRHPRNGFFG